MFALLDPMFTLDFILVNFLEDIFKPCILIYINNAIK